MKFGVILILITLGCSKKEEKVVNDKKYNLAFLYSGYEGRTSQLNLLDNKENDIVKIKKSDAAGNETSILYNEKHKLILSYFYGGIGKCDGTVMGTNIETKENIYYDVLDTKKACNVVGMTTKGDSLYIVSNNNDKNLFVEYNLKTREKKEIWFDGFFTNNPIIVDDKLYSVYVSLTKDNAFLWELNLNTMEQERIKINDEQSYVWSLSASNKNVYMTIQSDDERVKKIKYVYSYNIKSRKVEKIKIRSSLISEIKYYNDKLYITHSDYDNMEQVDKVTVYNLKNKKLKEIKVLGSPKQIIISNEKLYVYTEYLSDDLGWTKEFVNGDEKCSKANILVYAIDDNYKQIGRINPYSEDNNAKDMCFATFTGIN